MKFYAGIGSRQTPSTVLMYMTRLAKRLAELGFVLRSGGAGGADTAFEAGAGEAKEIFLPWKGFNGNKSRLYSQSDEAYAMAARFHPNWNACTRGARAMHARNCHQVLGADLDDPVQFVLCWTPNGTGSGGTGQAIRIARHYEIPVFDLGNGKTAVTTLSEFLKEK